MIDICVVSLKNYDKNGNFIVDANSIIINDNDVNKSKTITDTNVNETSENKSIYKLIQINSDEKQIINSICDYIVPDKIDDKNLMVIYNKYYESSDAIYNTFYCLIHKDITPPPINQEATKYALPCDTVYGNLAILKNDYESKNISMTNEDIDFLKNISDQNIGYLITPDNQIIQTRFDSLKLNDHSFNYAVSISHPVFNYTLKLYFDIETNNEKMNVIGTKLCSNTQYKYRINGNIFICLVQLEQEHVIKYINLIKKDFINLLKMITNINIITDHQKINYDHTLIKTIKQYETLEINKDIADTIVNGPIYNKCINKDKLIKKKG